MVKNLINFKKAWLGAFALLLMVGVLTMTFAFKAESGKMKHPVKTFANAYWRFNSGSLSDTKDYTQYTLIADPSAPGCDAGNEIPCVLVVDAAIDTPSELNTYLSNTTTFPTNSSVTASTPMEYRKFAD